MKPSKEGEICVAGSNTLGYLDNPEATSKSYIPNPFKDKDGFDTLFKTGDMGKLLEDGNIVCLGRLDNMVQINGQRVELEDIENSIMKTESSIKSCAVQYFKNDNGTSFLVAYIVGKDDFDFVTLETLPVGPTGKLDRKALKPPNRHQP